MINDRKEAILFIAKKQHGGKRELIGEIGEKFFNQFCRMGFIKKGITKDKLEQLNSTWQITKLGKEQENSIVSQLAWNDQMDNAFMLQEYK